MKTVKVRIAVAVDTDGDWVATGGSAISDNMSLNDARGDCNIGDDSGAHRGAKDGHRQNFREVLMSSVADIPDDELLRRVVRKIAKKKSRRPAWADVSEAFVLGSTYSAQLCRRFGIDPETGRDIEKRQDAP